MYPHRIRLRGPWEASYVVNGEWISQRVNLPSTWEQLQAATGPVTLTRSFGRPRVIDADESVWLAWDDLAAACDIYVNEEWLHSLAGSERGGVRQFAYALQDRNTLKVQFAQAGAANRPLGEFALEIRGPVYLEEVRLESTAKGRVVTGWVSGVQRRKLDLYLLANGRTVSHVITHAAPAGVAFRLPCPEADGSSRNQDFPPIRVELVEGATCWWRADFSYESAVPAWPE
jgi:hypothetical protein